MKLFAITALLGVFAEDDKWEISIPKLSFDTQNDEIYKMFQAANEKAAADASGMEVGIGGRAQVGTSQSSIAQMQLRKYETVKKMTLYLHDNDDREWGRYCPYGCHCMVNGPNDMMSGAGQPVDKVDSACKRHQECISCAMADFGADVCPWWKPYKMSAMQDTETGEKVLVCDDAPNFCKRSLCECDTQLAQDLYNERNSYDRDFHHRYGTFNKEECRSNNRGSVSGNGGSEKKLNAGESKCCGSNPARFPYSSNKQECCDGQLSAIGTC